jgi:hypothetical protein
MAVVNIDHAFISKRDKIARCRTGSRRSRDLAQKIHVQNSLFGRCFARPTKTEK